MNAVVEPIIRGKQLCVCVSVGQGKGDQVTNRHT